MPKSWPTGSHRSAATWRKLGHTFLTGFVLLVAAVLILRSLSANPRQSLDAIGRIGPNVLLGTLAILGLTLVLSSLAWREPLQALVGPISMSDALRLFIAGQLGKYVPGTMWSVVLQAELATRLAVPVAATMLTFGVHMCFALLTGFALAVPAISLPWASWLDPARRVALGAAAITVLVALPPLAHLALRGVSRLPRLRDLRCTIPTVKLYRCLALCLISWLVGGAHLWVLVVALGADPSAALIPAISGFALAISLGALVVIVPDGIGVRDGVMTVVLTSCLPTSSAIVAALLSRLLLVMADVLAWLCALLVTRRASQ